MAAAAPAGVQLDERRPRTGGKSGWEATNGADYSAAPLNASFRGGPTRPPPPAGARAQCTREAAMGKSLFWPKLTLQVVAVLVLGRTWNPIGPGAAVGRKNAWSLRPSPS